MVRAELRERLLAWHPLTPPQPSPSPSPLSNKHAIKDRRPSAESHVANSIRSIQSQFSIHFTNQSSAKARRASVSSLRNLMVSLERFSGGVLYCIARPKRGSREAAFVLRRRRPQSSRRRRAARSAAALEVHLTSYRTPPSSRPSVRTYLHSLPSSRPGK